jgi:hypothetical protein
MNVPLRVRASKAGYQPVTHEFPGFTNVDGRPEPRSLHFILSKNSDY